MNRDKVLALIADLESDRIERTIWFVEKKLAPAVCAFSNDFPNYKKSGYLLLGVNDDGTIAGLTIGDEDLQKIGNVKSNGNVLPQPSLVVSPVFSLEGGDVVVVKVSPSHYPPVRYDGRCWIRVGPRKSVASIEEERILTERRASYAKTYDLVPALGATLEDISLEHFKVNYLPIAIDKDILQENGRTLEEQLASLRFFNLKNQCPTNAGILLFGLNPEFYFPGAYIQYIKFDGEQMTDDVSFEKKFSGALATELSVMDGFIKSNIIKAKPKRMESMQEQTITNYPYWALRELVMNAIMHRNYESNSPVYLYEFVNRIEIVNPGGLYGEVTPQNFPNASDYRNVVLAEALKVLGYVNRFNYGIQRAKEELIKNGNGEPKFDLSLATKFKVTIPINQDW
ncbi:MAG TPA: ATP-binding protein [Cyclobacteriaceae bacterium]|nr:ATP-binding protein [Cyclobacteriaceae bacterium]